MALYILFFSFHFLYVDVASIAADQTEYNVVSLSVATVSPAKTAEPIVMPFRM